MKLFLAVTPDEYELPLYVADSIDELSEKYNQSKDSIYSLISRPPKTSHLGRKYVRVKVDEED